jgi:predicted nuclease with TOPRIM domain
LLSKKQAITAGITVGISTNNILAIEEEQTEYRDLVQGNQELAAQTNQLQQRIEHLKQEFQQAQQDIDKEVRVLSVREKSREQSVAANKALVAAYEDVLGIAIEPVSSTMIISSCHNITSMS